MIRDRLQLLEMDGEKATGIEHIQIQETTMQDNEVQTSEARGRVQDGVTQERERAMEVWPKRLSLRTLFMTHCSETHDYNALP